MTKQPEATDSVYRVTEVIGKSTKSWQDAAKNSLETAARTLRHLRIAEIVKMDMKVRMVPAGACSYPSNTKTESVNG